MDQNSITQLIQQEVKKQLAQGLKGSLFTSRKLTDNPTDDLQVVNRRYTNLNGSIASRPSSSIATLGQKYFAGDIGSGTLITFNGSRWTNGVGSIVA